MEECDFLDDTCLTVLSASKDVIFAAVVDANGKLIVGKYRKIDRRLIATTSISNSSDKYHQTTNCYLFYADYLLTAIRQSYFKSRRIRDKQEAENIEEVNFDVIDVNNKVKLAITPLTQRKDKFLCVYFESSVVESYQEIIMKINNII
ncbi:MAG TPA: hypothetical protein VFJ05_02200 [Nitrososphaeraceae archaeon]|nr:hypothetical protein [Nitrososphaeraceae archaeon]